MRAKPSRLERGLLVLAGIACIAALALILIDPVAALAGWVGAAAAFAAVPAGALLLQAMMRLIPGAWGEQLRLTCEAGVLLALPAGLAFVPVILGAGVLYPWASRPPISPFQGAWMAVVPFAIRTILWFALLIGAGALLRHRRATGAVSSISLVAFPVLGTFVAVDWLMSLDLDFTSSGYGLQVLILSANLALAALIVMRLTIGRTPARPGILGGLLLTLLLMWAYIQFLTFFIIWSGNLPTGVAWFAQRATLASDVSEWAFSLLGGIPLLMLLLARFRRSPRWMIALSLSVIAGKLIEFGWLALPGYGTLAVIAFALASLGLGLGCAVGLPLMLRRRVAARLPRGAWA